MCKFLHFYSGAQIEKPLILLGVASCMYLAEQMLVNWQASVWDRQFDRPVEALFLRAKRVISLFTQWPISPGFSGSTKTYPVAAPRIDQVQVYVSACARRMALAA